MSPIDVVIPAFNAARYLGEAIASVLAQRRAARRIIVVDDGSADDTVAVASAFGAQVEIVRRNNGGIAAARNTGIGHSDAPLLAFLDADDRWLADKLSLQAAALDADAGLDFVLCLVRAFASPELPEAERVALEAQQPQPFEGWSAVAMLVRRASLDRVGLFAEELRAGETIDWFSRARSAGLRHYVVPEVLVERRLHRKNTTRLGAGDRRGYLLAAKRHVDRLRKDRESQGR
ncbi:MAG TPA: glycosyltransferase family A protein [Casimicrobiaceae bacterium]|nr:glycosyltransferase family A protein [Casimicrobiaceae bacterium]